MTIKVKENLSMKEKADIYVLTLALYAAHIGGAPSPKVKELEQKLEKYANRSSN